MAQDFKLNGTTILFNDCQWSENSEGNYFNGLQSKNKMRNVRLSADVLEESSFDTIYALEGTIVSATITNYSDRNGDYKTYYGVNLLSVKGDHDGPVFRNITVDLQVKI